MKPVYLTSETLLPGMSLSTLTLVKGDEGVEAGEEGADGALLGEGGDHNQRRLN